MAGRRRDSSLSLPDLIFGGVCLGEFFIARNADNIVDADTVGTIAYGAERLGIPLIVVLGHERLRPHVLSNVVLLLAVTAIHDRKLALHCVLVTWAVSN